MKYCEVWYVVSRNGVAPHVGAWIEISGALTDIIGIKVAPHVGAWIEIHLFTAST